MTSACPVLLTWSLLILTNVSSHLLNGFTTYRECEYAAENARAEAKKHAVETVCIKVQ